MNPTLKIVTFIALLTATIFFISNEFLGGYLSGVDHKIGDEIAAPPHALYEWNLRERAPFKYRMLFPAIVKGSWQLLADGQDNKTFIFTYKFWSLTFLITSVISFFFLVRSVGFSNMWSLGAAILFLLSPAVLLAYTLPVHTREDTLTYTLLCLGLLCILHDKVFLFLLVSMLGVFCRETLLILPFVFLFFASWKHFVYRAVIAAIPLCAWLALRLTVSSGGYDIWEGLRWNLNNMEQVLGFSFITFHFMWPLFFYGLMHKAGLSGISKGFHIGLLYQSGLAVFILIITSTFIGGVFNEIRLLFLLFPWIITISLHLLYVNKGQFPGLLRNNKFRIYCLVSFMIFSLAGIYLFSNYAQIFEVSRYAIQYDVWIAATLAYIFITILFVPAYLKIFTYCNTFFNEYAKHY